MLQKELDSYFYLAWSFYSPSVPVPRIFTGENVPAC
jgi:hypothetical protein